MGTASHAVDRRLVTRLVHQYGTSVKKRVSLEGAADTDKLPTIEYAVAEVGHEPWRQHGKSLKIRLSNPDNHMNLRKHMNFEAQALCRNSNRSF